MKTRVIVQILRAPIGGIRKHVFDILEGLDRPNIKQIFITNTLDSDFDLSVIEKISNLEILHLEIKDQPGFKDIINLIKIYFCLKSKNVDVIHGHGAKGGLYGRIVGKLLSRKAIYTPHGGSLHRNFGKIKSKIYDFVEYVLTFFTDLFIFESNYSANTFFENIKSDIKYIINYNGIKISNDSFGESYQTETKLKIASFGLLRHLKGHDIGILSCKLLKDNKIPFEYYIYGEGECQSELISLIKENNLENEVHLMGFTNISLLEMKKYNFIFQPSRFESFGYVPVEAMALKIPVICSNVGGLKEIVSDETGFISLENSPESYFTIFKNIYNGSNEDLILKIDSAFLNVQKKFSKDAMIENLFNEYAND